jgi:hypothetical protein
LQGWQQSVGIFEIHTMSGGKPALRLCEEAPADRSADEEELSASGLSESLPACRGYLRLRPEPPRLSKSALMSSLIKRYATFHLVGKRRFYDLHSD